MDGSWFVPEHRASGQLTPRPEVEDIAGGAVLTSPVPADFDNAEVGHLVRKYMSTRDDLNGEYRVRLFHAIRDFTADATDEIQRNIVGEQLLGLPREPR